MRQGPAAIAGMQQASMDLPLREYLRYLNEPPAVYMNDREYLDRWLPIGAGSTWAGVELVQVGIGAMYESFTLRGGERRPHRKCGGWPR